jgi:hypothetical protein
LSSGIPEGEFDKLARRLVFAVGDVVFEDGRHVFLRVGLVEVRETSVGETYLRKDTLTVADQQTGLAAATVADDDKLLRVSRRLGQAGADRLAA